MPYIFWAFLAVVAVLKLLGYVTISWWWIVAGTCFPLILIFVGIACSIIAHAMDGR